MKTPSAIKIYKGLSIYRVANSPFWMVRVWDRKRRKYLVKSTGETSSILAKEAAQDLGVALLRAEVPVQVEYTFKTFAHKLLKKSKIQAENGERNARYVKTMHWAISNADWGLLDYFEENDVREIRTHTWQEYLNWLYGKRPDELLKIKNLYDKTCKIFHIELLELGQNVDMGDQLSDIFVPMIEKCYEAILC